MTQKYFYVGYEILTHNEIAIYPNNLVRLDLQNTEDLKFYEHYKEILIPFHIACISAEISEISDKQLEL